MKSPLLYMFYYNLLFIVIMPWRTDVGEGLCALPLIFIILTGGDGTPPLRHSP